MPASASDLAAQGVAPASDPYAAIRKLNFGKYSYTVPGLTDQEAGSMGQDQTHSGWAPAESIKSNGYGTAPDGKWNIGGFQSKYNEIRDVEGHPGLLQMTVQRQDPNNSHKYDTEEIFYQTDPATGEAKMVGEPIPSRQISSRERFKDVMEKKILPAAAIIVGGAYGLSAMAGGAAGAGAGGFTAAEAGSMAVPELGLATQTGLTAGGATAGGAGIGTIGTLGTIPASGMSTVAPLSTMGQIAAPAALAPAAAVPTMASFGGAAASAGAVMNAGDWIQLGGLALGAIASDNAQDSADAAAADAKAMSTEMLDFTKQQYADNLPYVRQAQDRMISIADGQIESQNLANTTARDYSEHWKGTFRPLEESIVADARAYDTPEKRQAAADAAMAEVNSGFAKTGAARARELAAAGVNPGSARAMSVLAGQDVDQAGAMASAAYGARKGVEETGYNRTINAASLGRNLPANQTGSTNASVSAGNGAASTSAGGAAVGTTGVAGMQAGYTGAGNLNIAAGNLQQRADDSATQLWGQLGTVAGRWATSSEEMKTGGEPIDPDQALSEIVQTPVKDGWRYDPAKMAAEGIPMDDGGEHAGPMAQDVNATMGEEAAPGGEKLDLVTMNGKTMAAIQALDKKVNTLASMLRGGKLQAGAQA